MTHWRGKCPGNAHGLLLWCIAYWYITNIMLINFMVTMSAIAFHVVNRELL